MANAQTQYVRIPSLDSRGRHARLALITDASFGKGIISAAHVEFEHEDGKGVSFLMTQDFHKNVAVVDHISVTQENIDKQHAAVFTPEVSGDLRREAIAFYEAKPGGAMSVPSLREIANPEDALDAQDPDFGDCGTDADDEDEIESDDTEAHAADCPSGHCGECLCGVADRVAACIDREATAAATIALPDPDRKNVDRAYWVKTALLNYCEETGQVPDEDGWEEIIGDFICDLAHFCDDNNIKLLERIAAGQMHYNDETENKGSQFKVLGCTHI